MTAPSLGRSAARCLSQTGVRGGTEPQVEILGDGVGSLDDSGAATTPRACPGGVGRARLCQGGAKTVTRLRPFCFEA